MPPQSTAMDPVVVEKVTIDTTSIPESLSQEFLKYKGTTIFAAPPSPTYRYSLTLEGGKLRVWLEDCESKEQWKCFHDLLNGACDDANSISSTFQRHKDNAFQLEMAVKIQVLKRSCVAKYSFLMEPISVERIDVLESKMRDLQEEMKGLRLKAVSGQNSAVLELQNEMAKLRGDLDGRVKLISDLRGKMNALCADNGRFDVIHTQGMRLNRNLILWDQTGSKNVVSADGTIKGLDPGTYLVMVVVNYYGGEVRLMKNSMCFQAAFSTHSPNITTSNTLVCPIRMTKHDTLSVHCTQNSLAKISYLTLARISE